MASVPFCGIVRDERKRSLGFAHHFRPTYALANVGHPSIPSDTVVTQELGV
jgi:hypothetical protein